MLAGELSQVVSIIELSDTDGTLIFFAPNHLLGLLVFDLLNGVDLRSVHSPVRILQLFEDSNENFWVQQENPILSHEVPVVHEVLEVVIVTDAHDHLERVELVLLVHSLSYHRVLVLLVFVEKLVGVPGLLICRHPGDSLYYSKGSSLGHSHCYIAVAVH